MPLFTRALDRILWAAHDDARRNWTPAPPETPGPSVTPPAVPESTVERAERVDELRLESDLTAERTADPAEALVQEEESAAAAEAAMIGGPAPGGTGDPTMDPVYQAGGGVAEGFEQ